MHVCDHLSYAYKTKKHDKIQLYVWNNEYKLHKYTYNVNTQKTDNAFYIKCIIHENPHMNTQKNTLAWIQLLYEIAKN